VELDRPRRRQSLPDKEARDGGISSRTEREQ
jgi:hypothetical protein